MAISKDLSTEQRLELVIANQMAIMNALMFLLPDKCPALEGIMMCLEGTLIVMEGDNSVLNKQPTPDKEAN